jgi:hypothetical protein
MTPIPPIPNDLANLYHSGGHCTEHQKQALIERIARAGHPAKSYQSRASQLSVRQCFYRISAING